MEAVPAVWRLLNSMEAVPCCMEAANLYGGLLSGPDVPIGAPHLLPANIHTTTTTTTSTTTPPLPPPTSTTTCLNGAAF